MPRETDIYVVLLTEKKFAAFRPRRIADAQKTSEVLMALSCESREAVDEREQKAFASAVTDHAYASPTNI